jgi:dynein heavy chain 1
MSKQSHYDFGLRAFKTLLVSAGGLKRQTLEGKGEVEGDELAALEEKVLIKGACNNVVPKLVAEDIPVFAEVLEETFPGSEITPMQDDKLHAEILTVCEEDDLVAEESFVQKLLQLNQVISMRHGVMLVGPVGSGKSAALKVLMKSLEQSGWN